MASGAAVRAAGMPTLIAEGLARSGLDTRALCSTLSGFLGKQSYLKGTYPNPAKECGANFGCGQGEPEPEPPRPEGPDASLPGLAGNVWSHPPSSRQQQWPGPRVTGLGGGGGRGSLHTTSNHPSSCCKLAMPLANHQYHWRWHQSMHGHGPLRQLHRTASAASSSSSDNCSSGNSEGPATARSIAGDPHPTTRPMARHIHEASSSRSSSSSSLSSRAAHSIPSITHAPRDNNMRSFAAAYRQPVSTIGASCAPASHGLSVPTALPYAAVRHVRPYARTTSTVMTGTDRHAYRAAGAAGPHGLSVQDILGRAKLDTKFEVLRVMSDGRAIEPSNGVTAAELGLHSRDLSLFAADVRLSPQRATITVRGDRILFRTEAIKAIIQRDQTVLIKNKRDRHFTEILAPLVQVVQAQPTVPFELSVLEVLLHVTMTHFSRRRTHIQWMFDRITGEASGNGGQGSLGSGDPFGGIGESVIQQLVPLQKVLTAVINDAKETCDAINKFLDDDREALGSLLISINTYYPHGSTVLPSSGTAGLTGGGTAGGALGTLDFATSDNYKVPTAAAAAAATAGGGSPPTATLPTAGPGLQPPAAAAAAAAPAVAYSGHVSYGNGGSTTQGKLFGITMPLVGHKTHAARREIERHAALEDASRILDSYLRELESIVGSLLETEDALDMQR